MPAPPGRILTGPQGLRLSRIQNKLNSTAKPRCRFGLGLPNRSQAFENGGGIDLIDRARPYWLAVNLQRHAPLLVVFKASPRGQMGGNILSSTFPEGLAMGGINPLAIASLDRIHPAVQHLAGIIAAGASLPQG
jgi:hypothetical protein